MNPADWNTNTWVCFLAPLISALSGICEVSQLCKVVLFVFVRLRKQNGGSGCQWNETPPPLSGRWGAWVIWWSLDGRHGGTFLRVQRITETLATHTLSSWPASAISVSLQLTARIVCRISSGGTSPTGPQRDLTATGPDVNPAQHVLYRHTKWMFTIIQVSHIRAGERLELHSKEHLSGGAEECGAWVAKADQEAFFFFFFSSQLFCRKLMIFILKSQLILSDWAQKSLSFWIHFNLQVFEFLAECQNCKFCLFKFLCFNQNHEINHRSNSLLLYND